MKGPYRIPGDAGNDPSRLNLSVGQYRNSVAPGEKLAFIRIGDFEGVHKTRLLTKDELMRLWRYIDRVRFELDQEEGESK